MADIGLNPPLSTKKHCFTGVMKDALAKFGSVVVFSGTSSYADVATTTSAGATKIAGVVQSQGDPNNSDLFATNAEAVVCDDGVVPVLVLGSVTYARGDLLITSTTAGVAKKLAAETGAQILGEVMQDVTTGSSPQLISVRLRLSSRGS